MGAGAGAGAGTGAGAGAGAGAGGATAGALLDMLGGGMGGGTWAFGLGLLLVPRMWLNGCGLKAEYRTGSSTKCCGLETFTPLPHTHTMAEAGADYTEVRVDVI
jgi:hypothetical protein